MIARIYWNLRFNLAWKLLPGRCKHVHICEAGGCDYPGWAGEHPAKS